MSNLYNRLQLNDKIVLMPNQLDSNLDKLLEDYLKRKVGNKCQKEGFIKKNSIKIIKRSIGKINSSFLNGSTTFHVIYKAEVCNPKKGDMITVEIVDVNKMGALAKLDGTPLNIVIPKQLHKNRDEFKKLSDLESNTYYAQCEIIGKRYDLNDNVIFIIAKLIKVV